MALPTVSSFLLTAQLAVTGIEEITVSARDARKLRVGQWLPGETGLTNGRIKSIEPIGFDPDDWFQSEASEYQVVIERPWKGYPSLKHDWLEDSFFADLLKRNEGALVRDTRTGKTYQLDGSFPKPTIWVEGELVD